MGIKRIGKHLLEHHWRVLRIFPPKVLVAIERVIKSGEATHSGQVRFVVEGALDGVPLFRNQSARDRALDIFSHLRIWDTAHNNGVLIYLLLADRQVEIVADRGIDAKVGAAGWRKICADMEKVPGQAQIRSTITTRSVGWHRTCWSSWICWGIGNSGSRGMIDRTENSRRKYAVQ